MDGGGGSSPVSSYESRILTMGEGEGRCWGTPGSLPRVAGRNHNLPHNPS